MVFSFLRNINESVKEHSTFYNGILTSQKERKKTQHNASQTSLHVVEEEDFFLSFSLRSVPTCSFSCCVKGEKEKKNIYINVCPLALLSHIFDVEIVSFRRE
jgi:hypothetical protein